MFNRHLDTCYPVMCESFIQMSKVIATVFSSELFDQFLVHFNLKNVHYKILVCNYLFPAIWVTSEHTSFSFLCIHVYEKQLKIVTGLLQSSVIFKKTLYFLLPGKTEKDVTSKPHKTSQSPPPTAGKLYMHFGKTTNISFPIYYFPYYSWFLLYSVQCQNQHKP